MYVSTTRPPRSTPRMGGAAVVVRVPILLCVRRRACPGMGDLTSFLAPVQGTISSWFGPRAQPTAGASTNHQGIDYAVPVGTPVSAAAPGTVIFAGTQSGFGNTVVVDDGSGVQTLYGHLSQINVNVGQAVGAGDNLALSGATGTVSGPNLHFQVSVNGVPVDPTQYLNNVVPAVDASTATFDNPDVSPGLDVTALGDQLSSIDPATAALAAVAAGIAFYAFAD
jgi:hypothetical protein